MLHQADNHFKFTKCSNIVGCWKELERALSLENFLSSSRICTISWLAKISSSRMILKESCNNYVWCIFSEGNENLITIVLGNLFESNHYYIRYIHSESRPISQFSLFIILHSNLDITNLDITNLDIVKTQYSELCDIVNKPQLPFWGFIKHITFNIVNYSI